MSHPELFQFELAKSELESNDENELVTNNTFSQLANFTYPTQIRMGSKILIGGGYSVGFRCRVGSSVGFITAGHDNVINQSVTLENGTVIGVVANRQLSGSVDAAYVRLYDNASPSNITAYQLCTIDPSWTTDVPINTVVQKEGYSCTHPP